MSTATMADITDVDVAEPLAANPPAIRQQSALAHQHDSIPLTTPSDLLRFALQSGADLDRLERLMKMQLEWEANEAKKSFRRAMASFKAECPPIFKRKQVGYNTREGDFVGYKHAELSDVTDAVDPHMARYGLTYDWDINQEPGKITVACIVTHVDGHSKRVSMEGPPDASGKKNIMQQAGSTVTYLERYTLLACLGKSTSGQDDDGGGASDDPPSDGAQQQRQQPAGRPAQPAAPEYCDQKKFDANKDAWREVIKSKRKTPAQLISMIESKGSRLNEDMKNTIDFWSREDE